MRGERNEEMWWRRDGCEEVINHRATPKIRKEEQDSEEVNRKVDRKLSSVAKGLATQSMTLQL